MDSANEVRKGEELDWSKLSDYLIANVEEIQGSMEVKQFHGGHANLTYLLQFGEREFVLRRPPFGKIAPGAHDMHREYKVLSKLYKHFDPAPRAYHYCEDEAIIGAPFVIMQRCTGTVIRGAIPDVFKKHEHVEQAHYRCRSSQLARSRKASRIRRTPTSGMVQALAPRQDRRDHRNG